MLCLDNQAEITAQNSIGCTKAILGHVRILQGVQYYFGTCQNSIGCTKAIWDMYRILQGVQYYFGTCIEFYRVYKSYFGTCIEFYRVYKAILGHVQNSTGCTTVQYYFGTCQNSTRCTKAILGHVKILQGVQKLFWDIYRILQGVQSYLGHNLRSYQMNIMNQLN